MLGEYPGVARHDPGRHHCAVLPQVLRNPTHRPASHPQYCQAWAFIGLAWHQIVLIDSIVDIEHAESSHSFRDARQHRLELI
jgi:hypothetical protein